MHTKVTLEIISTENPFSREQENVDSVKVFLPLQENMNEVAYFKKHFTNTTLFGNLVQIHDGRLLTEVYEKLSSDADVLLKNARPYIFFKKFLCTEEMKHELFASGCRVWLLQEPTSDGLIKIAELFAEKRKDGSWIVEARWIGNNVVQHLDYIFYLTTK